MEARRFHIRTFGCQMNEYDSRLLRDLLISSGWSPIDQIERSDLVVFNTCSVRHKAETRVFGHLGKIAHLKELNPEVKIAVVGCMAQRLGEQLMERFPFVDLVLGTEQIFSLPDILESESLGKRVRLKLSGADFGDLGRQLAPTSSGGLSCFVAITRGCDNSCSYCIVPFLRGRLRSRPHPQVLEEIEALVAGGTSEITLIGQNVNSYFDGEIDFPDLLEKVCSIRGVERVRFTTSHPKDFGAKLMQQMAALPQVCEHLHLPLQSGSNRILQRMNRKYSVEEYVQKVEKARERIPGLCLTTDLMVGFPGEREADSEETLEVVRELRFDSAFMFRYSPRQGTAAAEWVDDVPEEEKITRLNRLIALQGEISAEKNRQLEGTVQEVLVEGQSRREDQRWQGKTRGGKRVLFSADSGALLGEVCRIRINGSSSKTLFGEHATTSGRARIRATHKGRLLKKKRGKQRLLLIDDDPVIGSLLKKMSTTLGYQMEVAASGEVGLSRFRGGSYDVVISDLVLPDISGWEVVERVRGEDATIPILVMSGAQVSLSEAEKKALGALHILAKPFALEDFDKAIRLSLSGE